MVTKNTTKKPTARSVIRALKDVFEHEAKARVMEQFDIEFENPEPERPSWMSPGDWQKLRRDTRAETKRLLWRIVPDDYRMTTADMFLYRPPREVSPHLFALSDPKHVVRS